MTIDEALLLETRRAARAAAEAQAAAERAVADYHLAIRSLVIQGGALREVAAALGISHQRVHQIVEGTHVPPAVTSPAASETAKRSGGRASSAGKKAARTPRCSFCDRGQHELHKLIAGPGVFVCDDCLVEAEAALLREPARNLAWTPPGKLKCSFCGSATKDGLAGNGAARVCGTCVALCRLILTAEKTQESGAN